MVEFQVCLTHNKVLRARDVLAPSTHPYGILIDNPLADKAGLENDYGPTVSVAKDAIYPHKNSIQIRLVQVGDADPSDCPKRRLAFSLKLVGQSI
jgi:hypothetical protein